MIIESSVVTKETPNAPSQACSKKIITTRIEAVQVQIRMVGVWITVVFWRENITRMKFKSYQFSILEMSEPLYLRNTEYNRYWKIEMRSKSKQIRPNSAQFSFLNIDVKMYRLLATMLMLSRLSIIRNSILINFCLILLCLILQNSSCRWV